MKQHQHDGIVLGHDFVRRGGNGESASISSATILTAARWLERTAGGLEPRRLATAIADRYGRDRTFSVPILCRSGVGRLPWVRNRRHGNCVPQLPFELAACPRTWFRWLRLPVVSYALPALIALGQLRHQRRPSWNWFARGIRRLALGRSLDVLTDDSAHDRRFFGSDAADEFRRDQLARRGTDRASGGKARHRFLDSRRPGPMGVGRSTRTSPLGLRHCRFKRWQRATVFLRD